MTGKDEIRRRMRLLRRAVTAEDRRRAASVIRDRLLGSSEIFRALGAFGGDAACAVYLASPDEIDLSEVVRAFLERGVTVAAPRWNGGAYELAKVKDISAGSLRRGPMGILEPKDAEIVPPSSVAVWLVPGLAFTRDGRRLGYGGGWYDRLMAGAAASALKFGIAYGFQVTNDLPSEPHDIRVDGVVDDLNEGVVR